MSGTQGTLLICTFWLAHALALAGDIERAREVFECAVAFINGVGLLSEEVSPDSGELLGIVIVGAEQEPQPADS